MPLSKSIKILSVVSVINQRRCNEALFVFIELKQLCRIANVEKIDAGPKGISLSFRDNQFARPEQLIGWIAGQGGRVQLRPDDRLFVKYSLKKPDMQVPACREVIQQLINLL